MDLFIANKVNCLLDMFLLLKCIVLKQCNYYLNQGFQIFRSWANLVKLIPETRQEHYIWYLRFYLNETVFIYFFIFQYQST